LAVPCGAVTLVVEHGLRPDDLLREVAALLARTPAALRRARVVVALCRPAPVSPFVRASAHAASRAIWLWSPAGAPRADQTAFEHEQAHLLLPDPGHPSAAVRSLRDRFLAGWRQVVAADAAASGRVRLRALR